MRSAFLQLSAVFGFLAVALGAFGAHGLKGRLSAQDLEVFQTAARYQMVHALALGLVAVLSSGALDRKLRASGWCFVGGIVVFSGSLYALALTDIKAFGAITPIGGLGFMAGWILLFLSARAAGKLSGG